jgi:hypothetical protein
MTKESARPAVLVIVVEAKLRSWRFAADFAHAALAGEHPVVIHQVGVGDLAPLPVAGSPACTLIFAELRIRVTLIAVPLLASVIAGTPSFPILRVLRISRPRPFVSLLLLL